MNNIIKASEIKEITLFLLHKKIILHPYISPNGIPDFTQYKDKNFILILDRNILKYLINIVSNGTIKDYHKLKLIASIMAWTEFNGISLTAGIALLEYSYFSKSDLDANKENNIFLEIINNYNIREWINIAIGKSKKIPILKSKKYTKNIFYRENDHFRMHYLELLILAQLQFKKKLSVQEKFEFFLKWTYSNILIGNYSIFYAILFISNKSKILKSEISEFTKINKLCINQAWDLTYLSLWSTIYRYEENSKDVYLFGTNDKELRELFFITTRNNLYKEITENFGIKKGKEMLEKIKSIYLSREKPVINSEKLNSMIEKEKNKLKKYLKYNTNKQTE